MSNMKSLIKVILLDPLFRKNELETPLTIRGILLISAIIM